MLLMALIICCSFDKEVNQTQELREPEGYVLVIIKQDYNKAYGYIKTDDLELCTKNKIETVKVLYPYKDVHEEEFVVVEVDSIRNIVVGCI